MINRIVSFAKGLKRLWSLASAEGGDAREAKAQADNGVYLKSIESLSRLTKEIDFLRYQVDSWPSRRLPLKFGGRRLRVGLTYNMANNFYNLCNALRRAGVDAELVIWRGYEGSVCADPAGRSKGIWSTNSTRWIFHFSRPRCRRASYWSARRGFATLSSMGLPFAPAGILGLSSEQRRRLY
jgi:hypothetical protein